MIADFVPAPWSIIHQRPVSVFASLCEKMMLSTKPEAHNVLYCHQGRVKPWLRLFLRDAMRQTNRHTNMKIAILRTPPGGKVIIIIVIVTIIFFI